MAYPELEQIDQQYLQQDEERNKVQIGVGSDGKPRYVRTTEDGYLVTKLMGFDVDGTETDIQVTVDSEGRLNVGSVTITGGVTVDTTALEALVEDSNVLLTSIDTIQIDTLKDYHLDAWLEVGAIIYVGMLRKDGAWIIKKIDTDNGIVRYIKGASGYSFSNPASLSYDSFNTEF